MGSRAAARVTGVALVVAAAFSAAPTGTGWAGAGSRWPAARIGAPSAPGPACEAGAPLPRPGVTVQRLRSGGHARPYRLAVPASATPAAPAPLVLLLHGYTSTAEAVASRSGMEAAAMAAGAVVVSPQGLGEPSRWSLPGILPGPDDVAFVTGLLDRVPETVCVDRGRVVVAGFSNGAGLAAVLACSMGARLAGIALVSGANLEAGCTWPTGLPVVAFHGTADATVPFSGGPVLHGLLTARPVVESVAEWAARDGCRGAPERSQVAPGVVRLRWTGCGHPQGVALYRIDGGDHWWPRDVPTDVAPRPAPIDATDVILEAFGIA
jgi:polyhydroxybutyrate depolymerase